MSVMFQFLIIANYFILTHFVYLPFIKILCMAYQGESNKIELVVAFVVALPS